MGFSRIECFKLSQEIASQKGLKINDPEAPQKISEYFEKSVKQAQENEALQHGLRVEYMFAYVAGALDYCLAIKQEDSGKLYSSADAELIAPDYRLVTKKGEEFFVEVKNCHERDPRYKYSCTKEYFSKLNSYAEIFNRELKIAIYWSRWKLWSLVSADKFDFNGKKHTLSFSQAIKLNEMSLLGDCMLGVPPPLTFKVIADPNKPRSINRDHQAEFVIGGAEIWCGGKKVEDAFEQKLSLFFLFYSDWELEKSKPIILNNKLVSIDHVVAPEEHNPGQGFEILGHISTMISQQFNELTAPDGEVELLEPSKEPKELGMIIPKDYLSEVIGLRRIFLDPNYEDIVQEK